jgi:hypothetical protein
LNLLEYLKFLQESTALWNVQLLFLSSVEEWVHSVCIRKTWSEMYFHLPLYFVVVAPKLPSTEKKEDNSLVVDSTHEYYYFVCHAKEANKRKFNLPPQLQTTSQKKLLLPPSELLQKDFSKTP